MLKILEPNWKRASQGCCAAPLKNGSRIFNIPANGSHRADHHRRHWLARYFTRAVFPFVMVGTKKRVFGFPPKKPKMPAGRWCMVQAHHTTVVRWVRPKIFGFEMVSCFHKCNVGIREFSSIEMISRHKSTRVVYLIGYTKCTQTPKIIPYPGFRYTLPVPTVRWVHFLYLKPLVWIPFSTGAYRLVWAEPKTIASSTILDL